jgi:hypothetical protein
VVLCIFGRGAHIDHCIKCCKIGSLERGKQLHVKKEKAEGYALGFF